VSTSRGPAAGYASVTLTTPGVWYAPVRTTTAGADGSFVFPHVPADAPLRVFAEDVDGIPGEASTTAAMGSTTRVDVTLWPEATLHGSVRTAEGQPPPVADLRWYAIDAPRVSDQAGAASHVVPLAADGSFAARVPAGAFRLVELQGPAAAEGTLAEREDKTIALIQGAQAYLPERLSGDLGTYLGHGEGQPDYPEVLTPQIADSADVGFRMLDGRGGRTAVAGKPGLHLRRQYFVPASGAFSRTTLFVTNTGTSEQTVGIDASITTSEWSYIVATSSGGGGLSLRDGWVVRQLPERQIARVVGSRLPVTGIVGGGEAGPISALRYALTVPPGQTRAFMAFTVLRPATEGSPPSAVLPEVEALMDLSDPDALTGLTAEDLAAIANFPIPGRDVGLFGYAVGRYGSPRPGATVTVSDPSGAVVAEVTTDNQGFFDVTGLAPGTYTVSTTSPSGDVGRMTVAVSDRMVQVQSRLVAAGEIATLRLRAVRDGAGGPLPAGQRVRVDQGYGSWSTTLILDAAGTAEATVPAGYLSAETGAPPDFGWDDGEVAVGQALELRLRIGQRVRAPVAVVLGGDADSVGGDGVVYASGGCDPYCGVWSALGDPAAPGAQSWFPPRGDMKVLPGGREWSMARTRFGLDVTRRVFVPDGGRFARFVDVLHNPGTASVTVRQIFEQDQLGWGLLATSSGDMLVDAADRYTVAGLLDASVPRLVHVYSGAGAARRSRPMTG
jgi:hypothetical protein